ncbi:hypothetical protein [Streptacidiphilus albus]|uniref:hypothetical protein n=1 Tax=Streptacidiphilus albus TaxID=105425 RepID=UPI00054B3478|nr:hypothetical protein [Streptacidiphilus albus]
MWRRHRAFLLVACGIPLGVSVLGTGGFVFLLRTSGSWSVVGLVAAGALAVAGFIIALVALYFFVGMMKWDF